MLGIEANRQMRQGLPDEALADRQMDAPGAQALDIGQLGIEGLIEAQLLRVMLDQQLPGLGQLDIATPVLDQADADVGLELGDLAAYRGHRHAETVRSRAHRTELRGFIEIAEIQVLHAKPSNTGALRAVWPISRE